MKKYLVSLIILFISSILQANGQTEVAVPEMDLSFQHYRLSDKMLGQVDFYIRTINNGKSKPLLVFLDGSGNYPLFRYVTDKKSTTILQTISSPILDNADEYNLVLISKPGVPFSDTVTVPDLAKLRSSQLEKPNEIYNRLLSLDWRAKAADKAINHIVQYKVIPFSKIAVIGYSEGARVAPKVALLNKHVKQVACLAGGGLNQFYDYIITERNKADKGEITFEQSQRNIDSLNMVFDDIYRQPHRTDKSWNGHTYLRWSSFCKDVPLEHLLKLDIPIYIAKGTNDTNSQVLSYDYVKLEFLRQGKTNITYVNYVGADHGFNRTIKENGADKEVNEIEQMYAALFLWLNDSWRP